MDCDLLTVSVPELPSLLLLKLMGAVEARIDSSEGPDILPRNRRAKAVVVVLALTKGYSLARRELARLLWSAYAPSEALNSLRQIVFQLRQNAFMDALLVTTPERIGLKVHEVWIDIRDDPDTVVNDPTALRNAAIDLDDLDPALFTWLQGRRDCLRNRRSVTRTTTSISHALLPSGAVEGFPGRGTIRIREFRCLGSQLEQSWMPSFLQEVKVATARLGWLSVLSPDSATSVLSETATPWTQRNADFVVDITAQISRDATKLTTSLIQDSTGVLLGAWHTNSPAPDLDASQEHAAACIAARLEQEILLVEGRRHKGDEEAPSAYGKTMKAVSLFQTFHYNDFMAAGGLLRDAVTLEPACAYYRCWLAMWHMFLIGQGWTRKTGANVAEAVRSADQAVMLDPSSARAISIAGHIQAFLCKHLDEADALHKRAHSLNPGLPLVWELGAATSAYSGQTSEANIRLARARDLLPQHSQYSFYSDSVEMIIRLFENRMAEVVEIGRRITQLHPRFTAPYKPYLSALGHLGFVEEAKVLTKRLLTLDPSFSISVARSQSPYASSEMLKHYLAGLRRTGLR